MVTLKRASKNQNSVILRLASRRICFRSLEGSRFFAALRMTTIRSAVVLFLIPLLMFGWALPLRAADVPTQSISRSVELKINADLAWGIIKDFSGVHRWHPGFTDTELTGGVNGKPGALRVVAMKDGPRISEELLQYSESSKRYRYRMVSSSLPIDNYAGAISVLGKGNMSIVTWSVNFRRKSSSTSFTDADVKLMVDHLLQVGLTNLKRIANNAA